MRILNRSLSLILALSMIVSMMIVVTLPTAAEGGAATSNAGASLPAYDDAPVADSDKWDGSVATSFAGGSGTPDDPWQIANAAQLALMSMLINSSGERYMDEDIPVQTGVKGYAYRLNKYADEGIGANDYYIINSYDGQYLFSRADNTAYKLTSLECELYLEYDIQSSFYYAKQNPSNNTAATVVQAYQYDETTGTMQLLEGKMLAYAKSAGIGSVTRGQYYIYEEQNAGGGTRTGYATVYTATYTDASGDKTFSLVANKTHFSLSESYLVCGAWGGTEYCWYADASAAAHSMYTTTTDDYGNCTITFGDTFAAGDRYDDDSYILTANIDLNGKAWSPIGTSDASFKGSFDGNGKTVYGYKVSGSMMQNEYQIGAGQIRFGLFGCATGAVFKDICISGFAVDFEINAVALSAIKAIYLAGLCAYIDGGTAVSGIMVADSTIKVTSGRKTTGYPIEPYCLELRTGGIVGEAAGADSITNCAVSSVIYANNDNNSSGAMYFEVNLGGVVGKIHGTSNTDTAVVDRCTVSSVVTGDIDHSSRVGYVGGVIGKAEYTAISNCVATEENVVLTESTNEIHTGGIVGIACGGSIDHCSNYGNVGVDANGNTVTRISGGIAGQVTVYSGKFPTSVQNCVNYGDVSGYEYAGGVFAWINIGTGGGGNKQLVANVTNYGSVRGEINAGGIAGCFSSTGNNGVQFGVMKYCANYGDVTQYGDTVDDGSAGGICGYLNGCIVDQTVNYGTVTGCYAAGGIVGRTRTVGANVTNHIRYSDNMGTVTAAGAVTTVKLSATVSVQLRYAYAGGIVGSFSSGALTECLNTAGVSAVEDATGEPEQHVAAGSIIGAFEYSDMLKSVTIKEKKSSNVVIGYEYTYQYNTPSVNQRIDISGCLSTVSLRDIGAVDARYYEYVQHSNYTSTLTDGVESEDPNPTTKTQSTDNQAVGGYTVCENQTIAAIASDAGWSSYLTYTNGVVIGDLSELTNGELCKDLNKSAKSEWYQGTTSPIHYYTYVRQTSAMAASVTMSDDLAINAFYEIAGPALTETNYSAEILKDGMTVATVPTVANSTIGEKSCLKLTIGGINASDMDSVYTVIVKYVDASGMEVEANRFEYSILQYAINMYGKGTTSSEMKAVVEAMMHYGNAAEVSKNGSSALLADFAAAVGYAAPENFITDSYAALELTPRATVTSGVIHSAALVANGNVQVVINLKNAAATEATVTYGDVIKTYDVVDGQFTTDLLYATSLRRVFTVTVDGVSTDYSVSNYIVAAQTAEDVTEAQRTFAQAMAVYMNAVNVYADKYFAN